MNKSLSYLRYFIIILDNNMFNYCFYNSLKRYLYNFIDYYPYILFWIDSIKHDFVNGKRSMFYIYRANKIYGLAITKNQCNAKLCHISVSNNISNRNNGSELARIALNNLFMLNAQNVHVTVNENVLKKHMSFFNHLGFKEIDWEKNIYKRNTSEIILYKNLSQSFQNRNHMNCYMDVSCKKHY